MSTPVNLKPDEGSVTRISHFDHPLPEKLANALHEAKEFIEFYDWVSNIASEFLGARFDDIIYIFLFEIVPAREGVDSWIWVVVGDIPPAYMTCEDAKNPYEALDAYVGAMEEWSELLRTENPLLI